MPSQEKDGPRPRDPSAWGAIKNAKNMKKKKNLEA
jgi:hypothetical protein